MGRNPRKHLSDDHYCEHIYPSGHPRAGERCRAVKTKGSRFCFFHPSDPEKKKALIKQLADARESSATKSVKHGFYSKTGLECDRCKLADGCKYYEEGKKVCDFSLKEDLDLGSLQSVKEFVEEILKTEMQRYRRLEPFFAQQYDNAELFDLSSRIAKRMSSVAKDYAAISDLYKKRQSVRNWKDILQR